MRLTVNQVEHILERWHRLRRRLKYSLVLLIQLNSR